MDTGTKALPEGAKEVTLSNGKVARIYKGKGKDARQAMMETDGDGSLYLPCFMAKLIEIDSKKVVMEDLDELPANDYMKLQTAFAEINF